MAMPKRIVDGEALWRSDKLAKLPPRMRAEYANLIPLALANGSFECDAKVVWSRVYSYNRQHFSVRKVAKVLDELEKAGLLFRWMHQGKTWGYWIGIDKPGRLPSPSRLNHQELGIPIPKNLAANSQSMVNHQVANDQPMAKEELPDGYYGFGLGFGSGLGFGLGSGKSRAFDSSNTFGAAGELNATACAQKYCNEFSIIGAPKRDDVRAAIQLEHDHNPELSCEQITDLMVQARFKFLEIAPSERAFDWPAGAFLNEQRWKHPEKWQKKREESVAERILRNLRDDDN